MKKQNLNISVQNSWIPVVCLIICLISGIIGCGKDDDVVGPVVTPDDITGQGWELFERGEYDSSLVKFQVAIESGNTLSDAHNGAGWSTGRIPGMLNNAGGYFERSLELDTSRYDALGGWTFIVYQQDEWETALDKADFLLRRRPTWRFLHESSLDYNDVRILTASANFKLGRYGTSLEIIIKYLNNSFEADTTSPAGQRAILEEIERLSEIYG